MDTDDRNTWSPPHPGDAWHPSMQTPTAAPEPAPTAAWLPADPTARKPRGNTVYDVVLGIDLAWLGLNAVGNILIYLSFYILGDAFFSDLADDGQGSGGLMWFNNIHNLVVMGIVPFIWVIGTRVGGFSGALQYLHMQYERLGRGTAEGLVLGTLLLVLVVPALMLLEYLGVPMDDGLAGDRFLGLTVALVVATSLIAGVAEEILFRGILQRWVGVFGQAVLFGIMHILAGWISLVVTALIGLLFGYLVKRGHSLWTVIVAHVFYDLVLLGWAYYAEQSAVAWW